MEWCYYISTVSLVGFRVLGFVRARGEILLINETSPPLSHGTLSHTVCLVGARSLAMHLQPVAPSLTVSYRRCQCTQRRVSHKAEGVRVAMCLLGPEREAEREGKMVVGATLLRAESQSSKDSAGVS